MTCYVFSLYVHLHNCHLSWITSTGRVGGGGLLAFLDFFLGRVSWKLWMISNAVVTTKLNWDCAIVKLPSLQPFLGGHSVALCCYCCSHLRILFSIFRESERERCGERNINVRETYRLIALPPACTLTRVGNELQPRYLPLTMNWTYDPSEQYWPGHYCIYSVHNSFSTSITKNEPTQALFLFMVPFKPGRVP